MPMNTTRFSAAISHRNDADIAVPATPPGGLEPGVGPDDGVEDRARGDRDPGADQQDHARVAEREEEAAADRPLAVGHQLARCVVDRGDVVGVERVAGAERPGRERHAHPDAEALVLEVPGRIASAKIPQPAMLKSAITASMALTWRFSEGENCRHAARNLMMLPPFRRGPVSGR